MNQSLQEIYSEKLKQVLVSECQYNEVALYGKKFIELKRLYLSFQSQTVHKRQYVFTARTSFSERSPSICKELVPPVVGL